MTQRGQNLLDRTFAFGVDVLRFISTLPSGDGFRVAKYQLAKASTSVGSNYEEAQAAESKQDFIHKVGISLKEARESHYWLRILRALVDVPAKQEQLDALVSESAELKKIFGAIRVKAQRT